jgi:hypothetical protein
MIRQKHKDKGSTAAPHEDDSSADEGGSSLDRITLEFTAVTADGLQAKSAEVSHPVEPDEQEREDFKRKAMALPKPVSA